MPLQYIHGPALAASLHVHVVMRCHGGCRGCAGLRSIRRMLMCGIMEAYDRYASLLQGVCGQWMPIEKAAMLVRSV